MATLDIAGQKVRDTGAPPTANTGAPTTDTAASTPHSEPSNNPFSLKKYTPGVRKIGSFGLSLFLVGLIVTACWAPSYWVVSVLFSSACMALGWLTGFLFGVPRVAPTTATSRVNTNLEQISDWLTKILVGVGLTQIGKIPSALSGLAGQISKSFGVSGNDVFSVSMVLYFSTLGFLTGYLLTRLFLQAEFDKESEDKIELSTKGPTEVKVTQPGTDKAAADKAAADKATADQAAADKATADQAAADKAAADQAAADKAAADKLKG